MLLLKDDELRLRLEDLLDFRECEFELDDLDFDLDDDDDDFKFRSLLSPPRLFRYKLVTGTCACRCCCCSELAVVLSRDHVRSV